MNTVLFFISATRHSCRDRLDGILSVVHQRNWHVQVVERAYNRIDAKAEIDFWQPVGIIAECGSRADELNQKTFGSIPTVYFERDPSLYGNDTMLMLDSTAVGRLAAEELIGLGFEHFAYIPFRDSSIYWSVERGIAFCTAIEAAGKHLHRFTTTGKGTSARRTSLRQFLSSLPKPCALFVSNDITAVEVIDIASASGLDVPKDLSILSVDNDPVLCEKSEPKITSINPDYQSAGRLAANKLIERIDAGMNRKELIKFGPIGIVRRNSIMPPATTASRPLEERVTAYIRTYLDRGIRVPDIASALGLSRRTLEIQYKKATGKTLLEAIHDALFARACEMSASGRLTATSIPDFLQVSHDTLNRIFLARTGKTLAAWKSA